MPGARLIRSITLLFLYPNIPGCQCAGRDLINLNKDFKNSLDELLPQKLIPMIIEMSGISETKKVNEITKEERKNLVNLIKRLTGIDLIMGRWDRGRPDKIGI